MKPSAKYFLAFFILTVPVIAMAQSARQVVPRTPSEAYEQATQPLRDWANSKEQTLETNLQAWKEQGRRAKSYAPLFKPADWQGEQLLSLAQLYLAASQYGGAEKAYKLYLSDPKSTKTTIARKGLINALFAQEKWGETTSVVNLLLDEPKYDQEIILTGQTLVDALRLTAPRRAIAVSEKMLPGLFRYAEGVVKTPQMASHAALMLSYGLEPAALYRQEGDFAKAETYIMSFTSRLDASQLASNKTVKDRIELEILRTRLLGATAPPIEGTEYIGVPKTRLADLKGKVVMLDFWAHWCAPCIAKLPSIDALREKYGLKGLVIIGVTETYGFIGERKNVSAVDELAALTNLRNEHHVKYGFVVGPHQNAAAYGVMGLPVVVLIDRAGKVRHIKSGTGEGKPFEQMIELLLKEPQPAQ
jgi:thiol-disulfide isomerase/thioredoxin